MRTEPLVPSCYKLWCRAPGRPSIGEVAVEVLKRTPALQTLASGSSVGASPQTGDITTLDNLIHEVATPRTRATLEEYEDQVKVPPCPPF